MVSRVRSYVELTKPSIMLLVLFTGATSLVLEGSLLSQPIRFSLVLLALYLTGGSANALNMYFEREIDARMLRTARRRPLPKGEIEPNQALIFAIAIGVTGVVIFYLFFNLLTAALAIATMLFYGLFYTLWLKPNTPQNIVIGGIAGAMAPVGAWTAATGEMNLTPWILFLIVFLWTPPHFWVLAMQCEDDYRRVGLPMMPLVRGQQETARQVLAYTIALVGVSLSLALIGAGWIYLSGASILGLLFLRKSYMLWRDFRPSRLRPVFRYSLVYLFALFAVAIVDCLVLT
jgi:protoheme IX farnesyltransferase